MSIKSALNAYAKEKEDILYDRYINVDFYQGEENYITPKKDTLVLSIKCPETGMKPRIDFSTKALPESCCVQTTLTIYNLNIPVPVIRSWTGMVIEVGYKGRSKCTFECPLFNAYIAEPNPDGATVFQAVAVGYTANGSLLSSRPINVNFYGENVTIEELVDKTLAMAGVEGHSTNVHLTPATRAAVISTRVKEAYAENALSLIEFLRRILQDWAKVHNTYIDVTIFNRQVFINEIADLNTLGFTNRLFNVIDLSACTNVSFTGAKLEVDAPYNPRLLPGLFFDMPAAFFTGNTLPNALDKMKQVTYKSNIDTYYTLTMDINFSTTGSNTMHVTAIAVEHYLSDDSLDVNRLDSLEAQKIAEKERADALKAKDTREVAELTFGTREMKDTRLNSLWASTVITPAQCVRKQLGGNVSSARNISPAWRQLAIDQYGGGDETKVFFTPTEEQAEQIAQLWKAENPAITPSAVVSRSILAGDLYPAIIFATYACSGPEERLMFATETPGAMKEYNSSMSAFVPNEAGLKAIRQCFKTFVELCDNNTYDYYGYDAEQMIFIYYALGVM